MCLRNLTIQLKHDPAEFTRLDGEFYLSNETDEGRAIWIHTKDPDKEWFFRINNETDAGTVKYTYNWLYQDNEVDRIACAPGYVDSPLFCTTYVYAGTFSNGTSLNPKLLRGTMGIPPHYGGNTRWKIGGCDDNILPTFEPTLPTMEPSKLPSMIPTTLTDTDTGNGESHSNSETGFISAIVSLAALWLFTCICCGFISWKYMKNRHTSQSSMQSASDDPNRLKKLKSDSEVMTDGQDGLEIEAVEMVLKEQKRNDDMDVVASINQTDIGDGRNIIRNEMKQEADITGTGGIAHDANTDNGEDALDIGSPPTVSVFNTPPMNIDNMVNMINDNLAQINDNQQDQIL